MSYLEKLTHGTHTFQSPTSNLQFEYISTGSLRPLSSLDMHREPIVVQCPGWGLGSDYIHSGLRDLWNPPPSWIGDLGLVMIFFHPRGTGGSSRPQDASQMSTMHMASDLEDLRQYLELEQFPVLLGHSNGGAIALAYAEMYPTRVSRLILLNHQVIGLQGRQMEQLEATRSYPAYRGAWDILMRHRIGTDEEFTQYVRGILPLYFYDPAQYVDYLLRTIHGRIPVWCHRSQSRCDQEQVQTPTEVIERMKDVQARTLIISGRNDMICGTHIAHQTMRGIQGSQLEVYDRCGHFPWIEQRTRTIDDIRDFIWRK